MTVNGHAQCRAAQPLAKNFLPASEPVSQAEIASDAHKAYYDEDYHLTYRSILLEPEVYESWVEMIDWYYFEEADRNASLFDYGCGFGQAIAGNSKRAGWDLSAEARGIARANGAHVFDSIDRVPRGAWERVYCRHVLEHIEAPLEALKQMAELLTPNGQLILVLPREEHIPAPFEPDWSQHLYCWNFVTINNLLARAGLRPTANEQRFPIGWTRLARLRKRLPGKLFRALVRSGAILRRHGELVIRAERASTP